MTVQCPPEALGAAAGVLVYTFICLCCSIGMFFLMWVQHERTSYIIIMSVTTAVASIASIAQQVHTMISWRDIKIAQFIREETETGNPELSVTGSAEGLDLILFYIQFFCYNAEAILLLCWAAELTQSVFKVSWTRMQRRKGSLVAKANAMILPAVQIVLLRADTVQHQKVVFYLVASIIMATSLSLGAVLLAIILVKYVHTKISSQDWRVGYAGLSSNSSKDDLIKLDPIVQKHSTYDRWLVVRFSIAFLASGAFEFVTIMFQTNWAARIAVSHENVEADLSPDKAKIDFYLFIPGVSAGLLLFVVFGTTKVSRDFMWENLAPRWLKRKRTERAERLPSMVMPPGPLRLLSRRSTRRTRAQTARDRHYANMPRLPPIAAGSDMANLSTDLDRIYSQGRDEKESVHLNKNRRSLTL
ncbi:hypothetical protein MGG_01430 [Pyricularia oryzae 70-15]|uniref:Glycoside hydrolase n=2 Tax=Pyricularia oryzae TaxID=318829 RepID=G4MZL3_PYRO7|nr:uncharacterized protein MGG_01430 [Pyricularia oryzae 70-15]EHA54572.1 hypothetical protein MGG_01430 [Pyricularia oryzae 70-15]KAI7931752.1 hypothetical protein M9X92_000070 [Pyricularia oryzae]KAI7932858.1 hypothetical protein M0657_000167 [Pyricularia oryzae]